MNRDIMIQILQKLFILVEGLLFSLCVLAFIIIIGNYIAGENFLSIDFKIYQLMMERAFITCGFIYVALQITKLK
jgi:hypothetical protein